MRVTQIDPKLRALAHPLRLQMITLMWPAPMSAAELARVLGVSHALASHHLRRLVAVDLVELVEERTTRGGKERRYRLVFHRTREGALLSDQSERETASLMAEVLMLNLRKRVAQRAPEGEGVTIDADLWMDPLVWQEMRKRFIDFSIEMHDAASPPHTPGTIRLGLTTMAFPMTETPATEEPVEGKNATRGGSGRHDQPADGEK